MWAAYYVGVKDKAAIPFLIELLSHKDAGVRDLSLEADAKQACMSRAKTELSYVRRPKQDGGAFRPRPAWFMSTNEQAARDSGDLEKETGAVVAQHTASRANGGQKAGKTGNDEMSTESPRLANTQPRTLSVFVFVFEPGHERTSHSIEHTARSSGTC
jgi:hypothetical protein